MSRAFDARHLSSNKNMQVQMTNWYDIQIAGVSEDCSLLVRSCNLPEISTPPVDLPYGNSKVKIPGQAEYSDSSFVFSDAMKVDIEKQILAWQKEVYDPETGKMGWVDQYKRDATVTEYGPDGTCERVWKFEGCWPSAVTYGEMSHESSDVKQMTVTVSYDRAYRSK